MSWLLLWQVAEFKYNSASILLLLSRFFCLYRETPLSSKYFEKEKK